MRTARGIVGAGLLLAALAGCCLFPQTATLIIQNDSRFDLDEVYITPAGASELGEDWLPATIPPNSSHTFRGIAPGTYDVTVYDTEDGMWVEPGLVLDPGAEITLPLVD
jgi:hypothetical protein